MVSIGAIDTFGIISVPKFMFLPRRLWVEYNNDVVLALALLEWYDHTHGNGFGHDHHCPVKWNKELNYNADDQISTKCTCGWTDVLIAEKVRYESLTQPESP